MRLRSIENPRGFLLKIAYWFSRRRYGKVLSPLKIIYSRQLPLLFIALKIDKFVENQSSLPADLRFFIKLAAATRNGCGFCTDLALAHAVGERIGTEKFNALLSEEDSERAVLSDKERAVFNFVKEYSASKKISDESFAGLQSLFSEQQLVEIVAIHAFEQYFNALAIPLELESDGLQKFALSKTRHLSDRQTA